MLTARGRLLVDVLLVLTGAAVALGLVHGVGATHATQVLMVLLTLAGLLAGMIYGHEQTSRAVERERVDVAYARLRSVLAQDTREGSGLQQVRGEDWGRR